MYELDIFVQHKIESHYSLISPLCCIHVFVKRISIGSDNYLLPIKLEVII